MAIGQIAQVSDVSTNSVFIYTTGSIARGHAASISRDRCRELAQPLRRPTSRVEGPTLDGPIVPFPHRERLKASPHRAPASVHPRIRSIARQMTHTRIRSRSLRRAPPGLREQLLPASEPPLTAGAPKASPSAAPTTPPRPLPARHRSRAADGGETARSQRARRKPAEAYCDTSVPRQVPDCSANFPWI